MKTHLRIKGASCAVCAVSMAEFLSLGFAEPLLAAPATPATTMPDAPAADAASPARPAGKGMNDLGAFKSKME
ncbi:MAG: hypothetical protein ABI040_00560 [Rhodoferax sp.]